MKGFPGIKKYQDYCRSIVFKEGYILMNPITKERAHIPDFEDLKRTALRFTDSEFYNYYLYMKNSNPDCQTVKDAKNLRKRESEIEKNSINYRIQNRGAMSFKLSSIKLFNWIKNNNLLNIVLMCVPVHDEFNLECPSEIAEKVGKILVKCMEQGGKPFCPNVFLSADVDINDHWVH